MMTKRTVCAIGLAMSSLSLSAATPELLKNTGFEQFENGQFANWSMPKTHFRLGENEGSNGARGLVFENADDTNYYGMVIQQIPFEVGQRYAFSVWIKSEATSRQIFGIECYGENNKWLGGSYQRTTGREPGDEPKWIQIKGVSKAIPEGTVRCQACIGVGNNTRPGRGCIGKVCIDNASVRLFEPDVYGGFFCSAYRNMAADGKVTFRAALNVKGRRDKVSAKFAYFGADGQKRIVDAPVLRDDAAILELPVADLAMGRHPVGFELKDADGKRLGGETLEFERVSALPKRHAYLDGRRRLIVDGKPFFLLGLFCQLMPEEAVEKLSASPFNAVMPYGRPTREMLDRCEASNIKVVFSIDKYYHFLSSRPKEITNEKNADEIALAKVNELKDHPAIIAWYLNDEIAVDRMPILERRYELVKRADPDRPCWTLLCEMDHVHEYMKTFDVVGTDPYPVPLSPIGMAANWTEQTKAETYDVRPLWQIPQMFDWTRYDRANARYPTREEMVNMSWQCLAAGANGLIYYTFYGVYPKGYYAGDEKFGWDRWLANCQAAATVQPFVPVFLSDEDEPRVTCLSKDAVARAWRYRGNTFVAIVNRGREPVKGQVALADAHKELFPAFEQGGSKGALADEKTIDFELSGLGVLVLRLR